MEETSGTIRINRVPVLTLWAAVVAERLPGPGTVFLNVNWDFRAPVRPGDEITGEVEVLEVREDKPITRLRTTVTRDDGTLVLEGTAVCYTMALD